MVDIRGIDLNLLVILRALLEERNVSKAAAAVGLTQSAASAALGRLRFLFSDPLLIRSGNAMVLSARAEQLIEPVRNAFAMMQQVFAPEPAFDPATAKRTFVIVATDYVQMVLLAAIYDRIQATAPGIDLVIKPPTGELAFKPLEQGDIDLVFAPFDIDHPCLHRKTVFEETYVGVVATHHPLASAREIGLQELTESAHVMVSFRGDKHSSIDVALEALGARRRIQIAVPYFGMALQIVAQSKLLMIAPRRLAQTAAQTLHLKMIELAIPLQGFPMFLYWHARSQDSEAHRWLRQIIMDAAERTNA